jgi:DNA-directed RNA polymerase
MRYPNLKLNRIKLFLSDKEMKFRPGTATEAPGINKRKAKNAASPNFVHSMDACHLMRVLLACKQEGINSVALVHDSFGCLPNDAPKFRDMIRRTFRELYEHNDVLEQFRKGALEHLDVKPEKVPPVPPKGTLDLSLIEQSEYCFA